RPGCVDLAAPVLERELGVEVRLHRARYRSSIVFVHSSGCGAGPPDTLTLPHAIAGPGRRNRSGWSMRATASHVGAGETYSSDSPRATTSPLSSRWVIVTSMVHRPAGSVHSSGPPAATSVLPPRSVSDGLKLGFIDICGSSLGTDASILARGPRRECDVRHSLSAIERNAGASVHAPAPTWRRPRSMLPVRCRTSRTLTTSTRTSGCSCASWPWTPDDGP